MSMNDRVSDLLTRIRNAAQAHHETVSIGHTSMLERVAKILQDEGYLDDVQTVGEGVKKSINIKIKYVDGESVIGGMKRVSSPSGRYYLGYKDIKPVMNGLGMSILSTPLGLMTDVDARKKRVGGEVICNIW